MEDENVDLYVSVDGNMDISDDTFKEEKKTRKNGLLNWFKPRVFGIYSIVITTTSLHVSCFYNYVSGKDMGTVFIYHVKNTLQLTMTI